MAWTSFRTSTPNSGVQYGGYNDIMWIQVIGDGTSVSSNGTRTYYWHVNYGSGGNTYCDLSWGGTIYNESGTVWGSTTLGAGGYQEFYYTLSYTGGSGTYYTADVGIGISCPSTNTYKLNANGGTDGSVTRIIKVEGLQAKFPTKEQSATRQNYVNLGWSTNSGATEAQYTFGNSYWTSDKPITFYSVWKLDYRKPVISNLETQRYKIVSGSFVKDDDGDVIRVTGNFQLDTLQTDSVSVNKLKIEYKKPSDNTPKEIVKERDILGNVEGITYNSTSRSGTIDYFAGKDEAEGQRCDAGDAWIITVSIQDTRPNTSFPNNTGYATTTTQAAFAILDVGAKGKNVTFGAQSRDSLNLDSYNFGITNFVSSPTIQLQPLDSGNKETYFDNAVKEVVPANLFVDSSKEFLDARKIITHHRVKLWENATPISAFNSQPITLSGIVPSGLDDFNYFAIDCYYRNNDSTAPAIRIGQEFIFPTKDGSTYLLSIYASDYYRYVSIAKDVTTGEWTMQINVCPGGNRFVIPTAIYGLVF